MQKFTTTISLYAPLSLFSVAISTLRFYLCSFLVLRIGLDSGPADTGEEALQDSQDHYSERNVPRANH